MTDYYLIPTRWSPEKPNCTVATHDKKHWDWIRRTECSYPKSKQAAKDYELELNKGEPFDMKTVVMDKVVMFCVLAIPYNNARDYRDFHNWPCNADID